MDEDGDAPLQEAVAVEGDAGLLEAVHAGDAHYAGQLAPAAVASVGIGGLVVGDVGQVEPGGDGAIPEGDVNAADFVVGVLGVFGVALDLFVAEAVVFRGVGEDGPLGAAVEEGGDEVAFAGGDGMAFGFVLAGLVFAAEGGAAELAAGVVEALDAGADAVEVGGGFGTAGAEGVADAPLVPLDADGLDDNVEEPALVLPAFHSAFDGGFHSGHSFTSFLFSIHE